MSTSDLQSDFQSLISFDDLANLLAPLGTLNSPSELHGLLCGKLAGGADLTQTAWLLEAVEFLDFISAPDEKVRAALTQLHSDTLKGLQGDGVTLLLPDDDCSINERARCLSEWCHGFLTGFGSVELAKPRKLDEDDREMLQDIAGIVQIEVDDDQLASSAEADFMEIVEYVRMALASLYYEFAPKPASDSPSINEEPQQTLH
jgi:uncharacterized protein YgfB (UPF0149 family)